MKKFNRILKQLSSLYEFSRKIKGYRLKSEDAPVKQPEKTGLGHSTSKT